MDIYIHSSKLHYGPISVSKDMMVLGQQFSQHHPIAIALMFLLPRCAMTVQKSSMHGIRVILYFVGLSQGMVY